MRFWRRGNEDESAPETEAPEPRAERSWSNYADHFVVVIRGTDEWEREPFERAVVADFTEIGQELPLEEFVSELEAWLGARRGAAPFQIQIRRSYLSAGAAGVGAELVITFLGTAGGDRRRDDDVRRTARVREGAIRSRRGLGDARLARLAPERGA